jgi:hypothetical protein
MRRRFHGRSMSRSRSRTVGSAAGRTTTLIAAGVSSCLPKGAKMRTDRRNNPATHSEPVVWVEAAETGFDIVVGYRIPKDDYGSTGSYWYPCASDWARTAWGARRKARRLEAWYRRHVERQRIAGLLSEGSV